MSSQTLRVIWPILDEAMFNDEAIAQAWFDWPKFPEQFQVTVVDTPRMRVIRLSGHRKRALQADRAVICEAPVIPRISSAKGTPMNTTASKAAA